MRAILLLTATMLSVAGCQGKPEQSKQGQAANVLARVNGTQITTEDLNFRPKKDHGNIDNRTRSVDDVINQELFYQQGIRLKLDNDPSYRRFLEKTKGQPTGAKRSEMARRVFNTQIASKIDIKLPDAKDYYDKNAERIATALHLLLIKTDDRQMADEALKKIRSGIPFETVAQPLMGDAPKGQRKPWDQGFVNWENIPVDFVEPIYALKPGEASEVLGSQQAGFQIIKLVERRKIPREKYEEIQAVVMNRLRDLKLLDAFNKYIVQLRKDAKIEKY